MYTAVELAILTNLEPVSNSTEKLLHSMLSLSVGKGAINAPPYWELRDDSSTVHAVLYL